MSRGEYDLGFLGLVAAQWFVSSFPVKQALHVRRTWQRSFYVGKPVGRGSPDFSENHGKTGNAEKMTSQSFKMYKYNQIHKKCFECILGVRIVVLIDHQYSVVKQRDIDKPKDHKTNEQTV